MIYRKSSHLIKLLEYCRLICVFYFTDELIFYGIFQGENVET